MSATNALITMKTWKNAQVRMADAVVILHGIFRTSRSMSKIANFLQKSGFQTLNINYPSTKYSIENLADIIHLQIQQISASVDKIHFVGYSMGGLLIRAYIKKYQPQNIGRIVMIGTPNKGSEVADFIQNWWLYKKLYGQAGQQLISSQKDFGHIFSNLEGIEVGIIAGNRPLDLISSKIISKPNDGKVSVESTMLSGMKEHIIMPHNHTFIINKPQVWRQILAFLENGKFLD